MVKVIPRNQPIYLRNETYTGWLNDPKDLKIGDEIFHVPVDSWIKVINLDIIEGNFKVYDVVTSPLNTFIGAGILFDAKAPW